MNIQADKNPLTSSNNYDNRTFPSLRAGNRFHAYLRDSLTLYTQVQNYPSALFAEISPAGILTCFFGNAPLRQELVQRGISEGSQWLLDPLKGTAISWGLAEQRPFQSCGVENTPKQLWDYALYFHPAIFSDVEDYSPVPAALLGGLAIFVPVSEASAAFEMLASSIISGVILRMSNTARTHLYFSMLDVCRISFYLPHHRDAVPTINSVPNSLFTMFQLPAKNYYLEPLTSLLDPRPENEVFWDALEKKQPFFNLELTVSINGKKEKMIASVLLYEQPALKLRVGHLFLTSPLWLPLMLTSQNRSAAQDAFSSVIGSSEALQSAITRATLISQVQGNVMLLGESGTGKEVFAHAIHNASSRSGKPFVAVNCGALPRDLISSELFGYEGGAFTGADKRGKAGKFEQANGGTLFLDEIGELPLDQQVMLLRAVEQKCITRVGGHKEIPVDIRIICATNADLPAMINQKAFREDLYYRLSTFQLSLPPLRDRGQDILLLSEAFIQRFSLQNSRASVPTLTAEARQILLQYSWPGNIRELRNLMECLVSLYSGSVISSEMIFENLRIPQPLAGTPNPSPVPGVHKMRKTFTREEILAVLEQLGNNRSAAAEQLGISRQSLYNYMKKLHIN